MQTINNPCETCKHYRPPGQTELVGYCRRVSPQVVTWEERTEGECGHDGTLHEERQPDLFNADPTVPTISRRFGVTAKTIRNWLNSADKKIKTWRTKGGPKP